MIKRILYAVFLLASYTSYSQGGDNLSLYTQNKYVLNPAYTGYKDSLFACFQFRNQMSGVKGGLKEVYFNLHSPITKDVALGASFTNTSQGIFTTSTPTLSIAYKVKLASNHYVFLGMNGALTKQSLNFNDLKQTDQSDPLLINNDYNSTNYNFGAGLMYVRGELELSVAAPMITTTNGRTNNFLAYAQYNFWINEQFKLKPSLRVKRSLVKTYITDINLHVDFRDKIWLQAGYRTNSNILASAGVTIQGIGIGIGYELPISSKNSFTKSSLEVLASYQFPDFKRIKPSNKL